MMKSRRVLALAVLTGVVGASVSLTVAARIAGDHRAVQESNAELNATRFAAALGQRLNRAASSATVLAGFVAADDDELPSHAEFLKFTDTFMAASEVMPIMAWLPRTRRSAQGGVGARSDQYFPMYVAPEPSNMAVYQNDVAASPERAPALFRALATGKPAATGVIRFYSTGAVGAGVYQGVYREVEDLSTATARQDAAVGAVAVAIDVMAVATLVDAAYPTRTFGARITADGVTLAQLPVPPDMPLHDANVLDIPIPVAGATWRLEALLPPASFGAPAEAWRTLFKGLLITAAAAVGLWVIGKRIQAGRRRVLELAEAARRLHQVVECAPFPVLVRAESGEIINVNKAWLDLSGYARDDLTDVAAWNQRAFGRPDGALFTPIDRLDELGRPVDEGEHEVRVGDGSKRVWAIKSSLIGVGPTGERLAASMAADLTDRKEAEERLEAALAERNLLLREVYHRVKNNLQVIDSLVWLETRRMDDPETKNRMNDLRQRIHAMGLVHHQLMHSKDLATFDLAPFLDELCANLAAGSGAADRGVKVEVTSEPVRADLDFAVPLSLLVTELVTNAFKHAFSPDGGEGVIRVSLRPDQANGLELIVSDNGAAGSNEGSESKGLGTRITQALVGQLDGNMNVVVEGGTRVSVNLPLPQAA